MIPSLVMIDVEVRFRRSFRVAASAQTAYELLADIARSAGHFPDLKSIAPVDGQGCWRWQMKERGFGPLTLEVSYDAVYVCQPESGHIEWAPPGGDRGGDMDSYGTWTIEDDGDGARLHFDARTVAHIPAPRLMAKLVEAITREELTRRKQLYTEAIEKTLNS